MRSPARSTSGPAGGSAGCRDRGRSRGRGRRASSGGPPRRAPRGAERRLVAVVAVGDQDRRGGGRLDQPRDLRGVVDHPQPVLVAAAVRGREGRLARGDPGEQRRGRVRVSAGDHEDRAHVRPRRLQQGQPLRLRAGHRALVWQHLAGLEGAQAQPREVAPPHAARTVVALEAGALLVGVERGRGVAQQHALGLPAAQRLRGLLEAPVVAARCLNVRDVPVGERACSAATSSSPTTS